MERSADTGQMYNELPEKEQRRHKKLLRKYEMV
jgi:hypothetical protein